jgi:AraC-like DNA-binding protein
MAAVDDGPLQPSLSTARAAVRGGIRIEAVGSGPDAAIAELRGFYNGHDWAAYTTDRPFVFRYSAVGDADVTLRRAQLSGLIRGAVPPSDEYLVQWLTRGRGTPDVLQDRAAMVRDVPMLLPSARTFVFEYDDYDQRLVHLSRRLVHEVSEELFHTGQVSDLDIDHLRRLDPAAVTEWRNSLGLLAGGLRAGGSNRLVLHALNRGTARAFLRMCPPRAVAPPPAVLLPRRERLRVAVEYIHEHITEPLRVADIAAAAGLGVRSTQEGFLRTLGQTPLRYVRHVRLERVRLELLQADPGAVNVRTVAQRWGFTHLGRFSAAYRATFGEYPHVTLRR